MKKNKYILFFLVWLFAINELNAQLDVQYSHYMDVPEANNPGAVATNDMLNLFGIYRLQWAGFKNGPKEMFFSFSMPLEISGTKHGVGLVFNSDELGLLKSQDVLLQYSYKMKLYKGVLGLGLNIGCISQTYDKANADFTGNGNVVVDGDEYHSQNDAYIYSDAEDNALAFDVSVGCFYSDEKFFAGVAVEHLNSKSTNYGVESALMYVPRIFYLSGGYNILTSNSLYILKPSTQMRTDFKSYQMELSCLLEYDKKINGGLSYRFGDSFVFLLGGNLVSGLNIGYSYDLPVSKMIVSGGSHEVYLRYSFKLDFAKKNRYKSDRIL